MKILNLKTHNNYRCFQYCTSNDLRMHMYLNFCTLLLLILPLVLTIYFHLNNFFYLLSILSIVAMPIISLFYRFGANSKISFDFYCLNLVLKNKKLIHIPWSEIQRIHIQYSPEYFRSPVYITIVCEKLEHHFLIDKYYFQKPATIKIRLEDLVNKLNLGTLITNSKYHDYKSRF